MLRSGDWIVPTENGLPFFHKPPLFYWLTAVSMQVFGPNAAAARFAPLLGACLATLGFWATTRRRAGAALADARRARARDDAVLLRRRAIRQPRHAGRRLHRAGDRLRGRRRARPCARGERESTCARPRLDVHGPGRHGQGADRHRPARPRHPRLARRLAPGAVDPAPGLAARHRRVRADRGALVRRRAAAVPGIRALLLHLPPLRTLRRQRVQQREVVVVLSRRRAAPDAALVALAGACAPARPRSTRTPIGAPGAS